MKIYIVFDAFVREDECGEILTAFSHYKDALQCFTAKVASAKEGDGGDFDTIQETSKARGDLEDSYYAYNDGRYLEAHDRIFIQELELYPDWNSAKEKGVE